MAIELGSVDHLSQVIGHVVAPSFLLGAVAAFVSIIMGRLETVLSRVRALMDLDDNQSSQHKKLKQDLPRLKRRLELLNRAMFFAVVSGMVAVILIFVAFLDALISLSHVWSVAILFMLSLLFLFASLGIFAVEIRIGLSEIDHRGTP